MFFFRSITPSNSTLRSFSSNIISAVSFAISTAVSTEIPTSEFVNAGLSFIPSPIYPTTFPFCFKTLTILAFCIGESFANILFLFNNLDSATSDNVSILFPVMISFEFIPALLQTHLVTSTLSPVRTITLIPALFNHSISSFALSFIRSRKPNVFFISTIKIFFIISYNFLTNGNNPKAFLI